jgi:prepilin-type N-terminal cleavage/methylation domain-containing protein
MTHRRYRAVNRRRGQEGFSLIESLVALVLLVTVMSAVLALLNPASVASFAQPEAIDVQQRARVAVDALHRDLMMAGAGLQSGPGTGALINSFAAVVPRRMGLQNADAFNAARPDVISLHRAAAGLVQTTLLDPMAAGAAVMTVAEPPSCFLRNGVCGLVPGMALMVFDDEGKVDWFGVSLISGSSVSLELRQPSSSGYSAGAYVAEAESDIYWHDPVARQLRHYDGYLTDVPVVDNVASVRFEYFGDPAPPVRPKPPPGTANCLHDAAGSPVPGLLSLTAEGGSLAPLPLSLFADGPWCGAGTTQFDADLLRVRRIRCTIRIEAAQPLHRRPGVRGSVADYTLTFDVTPRNLGAAR